MKILHIIPTLAKGGAERLVLDICNQLSKSENVEVKLVIFRNEVKYDISEFTFEINVVPSKIELSLTRKTKHEISALEEFINHYKPDIIHTHLFEAELVSRAVTYPQAKWFSHCHDNMLQMRRFSLSTLFKKLYLTNFYEKWYLFKQYRVNKGTHFIAISKHTLDYFKKVQSFYTVTQLHNAINQKRFNRPAELINTFSNEIRIVNIGSFVKKKNQDFLIAIIYALNKLGIKTKTFFLGDGPTRKEVEKKARIFKVLDQCMFVGNVDKVEQYLWKADIYVHTAIYEPLGLVMLEAMAAGLPVICLDGKGNRDLMIQGKNGYIFKEANAKIFADKIIDLLNDSKKYEEISLFAKEFAKQFDIKIYCEKLLQLYYNKVSVSKKY